MDSDYSDEEIVENPTFKAAYNLEPLHHNQRLRWDHQVRLIGEKVFDPQIHLCEKCQYPILVYGRMLPCKHVFCLDCAKKYEKLCPRCDSRVQRIEQSALGTVFICTHGAPKHSINGCRRTYLSKRDLQAHIAHRHSVKASSTSSLPSGDESKSSSSVSLHHQQQHPISSSSLYDRHDSSSRERDSRSDSLRSSAGGGVERDRGGAEQAVYRPIDGPPPASLPPIPQLAPSHLQHPPPPAGVIRHPPPTMHAQLRMPITALQQQPPPVATTMESYVTVPVSSMGGVSSGNINRTNQNLITVPIQDEGADSYHTSRRQPEMSSYPPPPHSVPAAHPTAPPPAAYSSAPPPHLSMPPPGPFNSANLVGVGRIPFSTAPLVQAVAHLTHALTQQQRAAHPQRMNIPVPVSSAPPSRFPNQPPFSQGSPMAWSGAMPRQGQPPPRHQPPPGQRPPSDSGGYNQYY